jgi:hypothetical protein
MRLGTKLFQVNLCRADVEEKNVYTKTAVMGFLVVYFKNI